MARVLIVGAFLLSALTAGASSVFCWQRRASAPVAARALTVITGALAWWAGAMTVVGILPPEAVTYALSVAHYPGVCASVAGFAVLAQVLADPDWRPSGRLLRLLLIEPTALAVVLATNGLHHLLMVSRAVVPGGGWVTSTPGPLFWVHMLYSYVLLGRGGYVLLRTWRGAGSLHRRQLRLVFAGMAVPFVGNIVCLAPLPVHLPDLTAIFFTVTAVTQAYAVFRVGLMDLVPLARGLVFDRLADGVLVLDQHSRVVDLNPSAAQLLALLRPDLDSPSGATLATLLAPVGVAWPPGGRVAVPTDAGERVFDVQRTQLEDGAQRPAGEVVVFRDVTALAAANEQLRRQLDTIEGLRADLAEQAARDELTGLHNRRHLVTALGDALHRARGDRGELCLILLDIDHFKAVNDTYGHAVGDAVLVAVARVMTAGTRRGDTVARHGGEEFVVLLPGSTLDQARARAEQLRRQCSGVVVTTPVGPVTVTISAGVASTRTVGLDADALLRVADEALYAAKAAGRDRVMVGQP